MTLKPGSQSGSVACDIMQPPPMTLGGGAATEGAALLPSGVGLPSISLVFPQRLFPFSLVLSPTSPEPHSFRAPMFPMC